MTFGIWKKRAAAYAQRRLGTGDLFDESDPYEIKTDFDPHAAFTTGEKPSAYVRRVFEEDFAMEAYDNDLAKE